MASNQALNDEVLLLSITAPIRLVSVTNLREHWAKKARRAADHRGLVRTLLANQGAWKHGFPVVVTITRIAPRALDGDNAQAAAKNCRDGVADHLGVPDNDPRVTWLYAQERGGVGEYAVRIEIKQGGGQ
jgi:hypothetical protein